MKKSFYLLACLLLLIQPDFPARGQTPAAPPAGGVVVPSDIDPAKAAEIRKLLQLTGTEKLMNQIMAQMFEAIKSQQPGVPPATWDRIQKELDTTELLDDLVPLYDKYYSLDDLKAANAFYASPAGQRILAANPQIMRESMQIGQAWGRKFSEKVETEIQEEKAAAPASGGNAK